MTNDSEQNLIVGALVRWTGSKNIDTYGVITEIANRISVRWDTDGHPPQFVTYTPPLARVGLSGQRVERISTGETAVAMLPLGATGQPMWECLLSGNLSKVNVPESDLRPIPITDPVERFQYNKIGSLEKYRLQEVTRWYLWQHMHNDLVSLGNVRVDIMPHQVGVVHKVISNYPHRFMLCDEVGLGKTIEAGMALKELRIRGGAQRVLIIAPSNLARQWQFEMKTKFNESFAILNTNTVNYIRSRGYPGNPFTYDNSVICSSSIEAGMALKELRIRGGAQRVLIIAPSNLARQWQFEMKTKFNESFAILNTNTVNYIRSRGYPGNPFTYDNSVICSSSWVSQWSELCKEVDWDFIIVDARMHEDGRTTGLYDVVHDLALANNAARSRSLLLLTATPMQLGTHEIYALVELLDPVLFPSPQDFEQHRKSVPGLNRLVERIQSQDYSVSDDDVEQVSEWLGAETDVVRQRFSAGEDERDKLADELSDRHLLSEVMIRNRKSVVGGFMPRKATRWEVELSQEEREATEALEDYIQYGFNLAEGTGGNAIGFVMVTFQKLMASSIAAIKSSLQARRERIEQRRATQDSEAELVERLDDDDNAGDVIGSVGSDAVDAEIVFLSRTIDALNRVTIDSKSGALLEQLSELYEEDSDQKVLIFTQFRETQNYLADLLGANGWEINLFHGQMNAAAKDRAVESFRNNTGRQILISTEAGGEGRNLQFCHMLVNYDLPWNPMKVEQRIGRIDRIGQENVVNIFNLWVKGTIEERVLDVLENRINVFQETVGGLDPILGDTENDIQRVMRMSADARESALLALGERLESDVRRARDAEKQLGDFIMDTKSFGREIAERIAGQASPIDNDDIDRFMGQLLSDVRTYIRRSGDGYQLTFHDDFVADHRALFPAANKLEAVFRPDQRTDSQDVELMAFGNPIVDAIVEQVLGENYDGVTGTRRILASDDLAPVSGWLFTFLFKVPGVRSIEHLVPAFVTDSGKIDTDMGQRIVERACLFDADEEEIDQSAIPGNLNEIRPAIDDFVNKKREAVQSEATIQAASQVDQEIARLTKYFDYRERVARDKLEGIRNTLSRLSESLEGAQQRQVLRIWEFRVADAEAVLDALPEERKRQMEDAEKFRHPAVAYALSSLGRIEVIEKMDD